MATLVDAEQPSFQDVLQQIREAQIEAANASTETERIKAQKKLEQATQTYKQFMGQYKKEGDSTRGTFQKESQNSNEGGEVVNKEKDKTLHFHNKEASEALGETSAPSESTLQGTTYAGNVPSPARPSRTLVPPLNAPTSGSRQPAEHTAPLGQVFYNVPPGKNPAAFMLKQSPAAGLEPANFSKPEHRNSVSPSLNQASNSKQLFEGQGIHKGAPDADNPPNSIKDRHDVACALGGRGIPDSIIPPDEGLFHCLEPTYSCASWGVYDPEKYTRCLKKHGYWNDEPEKAYKDDVLYACIHHPRGSGSNIFRSTPRTRNSRFRDLDYSVTGQGLYGNTPQRRMTPCLIQYRYLQWIYDRDCAQETCADNMMGICQGDRWVCVPNARCAGPKPLCLENSTGKFHCSRGRWVCSQMP